MGSVCSLNRCTRFRDKLEKKIIEKCSLQEGDLLEVVSTVVGTDDSDEISRVFVIVRNKRTGDEGELMFDHCLYDPNGSDQDNVERLHGHLFYDQGYEEKHDANRKKVIKLLKDAQLISPRYKEHA